MARDSFKTLTEQMFYILLLLIEPRHGYEIMQECTRITKGRVEIGAGTLYALFARFEEEGYIKQVSGQGRKKVYQITKNGRLRLEEECERLKTQLTDASLFM